MKKYTPDEKDFLKSNINLKESFDNGNKVDISTKEFKRLAAMQLEHYNQNASTGCASCLTDLFKNLFNKLREELEEDAKSTPKVKIQAIKPTPQHEDAPTSLEDARAAYRKQHLKEVPINKKNNLKWINSKL